MSDKLIKKAPIEPEVMSKEGLWEVDPEKTQEHWLELRDPNKAWGCYVKWDGCTVIWELDHEGKESQSIHICELEDFIVRLQAAVEEAHKHFGKGNWPG